MGHQQKNLTQLSAELQIKNIL